MRDVFDVRWFFPPPSSHSTTPHSTTDTPFTQGRLFAGKMQRQFANFLESGKNYFHTISCLLINQAHISKGVCVESCRASLQGVLEICRTNVPPCVRKPLILFQNSIFLNFHTFDKKRCTYLQDFSNLNPTARTRAFLNLSRFNHPPPLVRKPLMDGSFDITISNSVWFHID